MDKPEKTKIGQWGQSTLGQLKSKPLIDDNMLNDLIVPSPIFDRYPLTVNSGGTTGTTSSNIDENTLTYEKIKKLRYDIHEMMQMGITDASYHQKLMGELQQLSKQEMMIQSKPKPRVFNPHTTMAIPNQPPLQAAMAQPLQQATQQNSSSQTNKTTGTNNMTLTEAKLDFWIKHNYNVLFIGKHGVGKTSMITDAFNRNNLKWKYYSAATIDPWVDFVGVPKEVTDANGNTYLDLVRPKEFANDEVEALFFDEYNRCSKKTANAIMELIQFKSINGKKFKNLKVIWAAINPIDDENQKYNVEEIDAAQLDRFHIQIELPYKASPEFFSSKYGELGAVAVKWWSGLPQEKKNLVSPRRLEYTLDVFSNKGDIRDVLPKQINIQELIVQLNHGSFIKRLEALFNNKNAEESAKELLNENFYNAIINDIINNENYFEFFSDLLSDEKISKLVSTNTKFRSTLLKNKEPDRYKQIVKDIIDTGGVVSTIRDELSGWINDPFNPLQSSLNRFTKNSKLYDKAEERKKMLSEVVSIYSERANQKLTETVTRFIGEFLIRSNKATVTSCENDICRIILQVNSAASRFDSSFEEIINNKSANFRAKHGNRINKIFDFLNVFYQKFENTAVAKKSVPFNPPKTQAVNSSNDLFKSLNDIEF